MKPKSWNYIFASDNKSDFDSQLLEHIKEKNNEHVKSILQNAENLCTAVDSSGASLLHYAAECGNEILAKLLIESGTNVDLQDQEGNSPLILATKGKHKNTIRLLLHNDADMYVCDNNGISALFMAVHENPVNFDLIQPFLIEIKYDCYGVKINAGEIADRLTKVDCPLYVAACFRNTDILKCLLSKGAPIDTADPTSKRTALHVAVEAMNVECVKFLVNQGANVNALDASKQTPLALIRHFQDTLEEQQYFEEFGIVRSPSVFWEQTVLEILVKSGTNLTACTEDGFMQVYWTLTLGTHEAVKTVLLSGLDLQARDSHGRTPVHYLALNERLCHATSALDIRLSFDTRKGLSERRKNKSWMEHFKYTFIDELIDLEAVKKVESEIINWNASDNDGRTALHHAMSAGNAFFVYYLLKKGVDVNIRTPSGASPLLEAVDSPSECNLQLRVRCVKMIMDHDAADPVAEIERYFATRRTKSAINRQFALLKPVLAVLVHRDASGEEIPERVRGIIESHKKLKEYVDFCQE